MFKQPLMLAESYGPGGTRLLIVADKLAAGADERVQVFLGEKREGSFGKKYEKSRLLRKE